MKKLTVRNLSNRTRSRVFGYFVLIGLFLSVSNESAATPTQIQSERADAVRIAELIKSRTSKVCDGNIRQLIEDKVVEYKDVIEYNRSVSYAPPTDLDRLNNPGFRGLYTISYGIAPSSRYYRLISPQIIITQFYPGSGERVVRPYQIGSNPEPSDAELDAYLARQSTLPWRERFDLRRSPVPLRVTVANFDGRSVVTDVQTLPVEKGGFDNSYPVHMAFMPYGSRIQSTASDYHSDRQRINGFWNHVVNIDTNQWFSQTCSTYLHPAKVAATAFLLDGNAQASRYIYDNFSYYSDSDLWGSVRWRNAVFRSIGANFALDD